MASASAAGDALFDIDDEEAGRCAPGSYVFAAHDIGQSAVVGRPVQGVVAQTAQLPGVGASGVDHEEAVVVVVGDEPAAGRPPGAGRSGCR